MGSPPERMEVKAQVHGVAAQVHEAAARVHGVAAWVHGAAAGTRGDDVEAGAAHQQRDTEGGDQVYHDQQRVAVPG